MSESEGIKEMYSENKLSNILFSPKSCQMKNRPFSNFTNLMYLKIKCPLLNDEYIYKPS